MSRVPLFNELKRVHIVGVGGTLMGAFATFLVRRGISVTGSDQVLYPPMSDVLKAANVPVFLGYARANLENLNPAPQLIIIGNVISKNNPEAQSAMESGIPYTSLPEAMETMMLSGTLNCVVSGTHGKTTTSSLLAFVLRECGLGPNFFIGGVSHDLPHSFHLESLAPGTPFVLEGDEYDTAFWDKVPKFNHYLPDHAILTSVEFDHADIYKDLGEVERAFKGLICRVREGGHLIACLDYPSVQKLISDARVPVVTYSKHETTGADFWVKNLKADEKGIQFGIGSKKEMGGPLTGRTFSLQLPGEHNAANAVAVIIECLYLNLDLDRVTNALQKFQGIKRRQEVRYQKNDVVIIDDFAHHPTAVKETLAALKNKYPLKRHLVLFEPRSATSRRKIFQAEYAKSFSSSDCVWISTPYDTTKIPQSEQFSSEQLVADLNSRGINAKVLTGVDHDLNSLVEMIRPGDVVSILSNGSFDGLIPKLMAALKSRDAATPAREKQVAVG